MLTKQNDAVMLNAYNLNDLVDAFKNGKIEIVKTSVSKVLLIVEGIKFADGSILPKSFPKPNSERDWFMMKSQSVEELSKKMKLKII